MMKCVLVVLLLFMTTAIPAELIPDQMVTWSNFSFVTCIAIGHDFVFFGTTEGILRYHRFERTWYTPITISDGLPSNDISRMAASPDDAVLYIETTQGIYRYDFMFEQWFSESEIPPEFYVSSGVPAQMPRFYMPFEYSMPTIGVISDKNLRDFRVTAYVNGDFNMIYSAAWGLGPLLVDGRDFETKVATYGLVQKRVDAIYKDGDSLWIGGNEGNNSVSDFQTRFGVTCFNLKENTFQWFEPRYINGFDSEIIYDITGDEDDIYFAGQNGVTVLTKKDKSFFTLNIGDGLPDNEATAVAIRNDSLWIGTARGLALYHPSIKTVNIVGRRLLGDLFITDVHIAKDKLIIGTTKGAYYIDFVSKLTGRLKDPEGDLGGEIRHISQFDNEVLISTEYGLTTINMLTEKARSVPHMSGPGGTYAAAANDKLYVGITGQGLQIVTREENRRNVLNQEDGLPSIDINALLADGKYLWIGSAEGLTRFYWLDPRRVD
ncbi:MAG: hypothetical protein R3F48_03290 [Candidatus Zixiibacteriota bacterium]